MIPIKNKKKSLEATVEEMRNFSFAYIEKYSPSKQQLKTYLLKKYLKTKIPSVNKKNITNLIDVVTEDMEKTKFINDKFYSNSKAKTLIQRGSSINKIRNYLLSKGIKDKYIKETIYKIKENNEDQDFFSAIKICKKKRIGPSRDENNRPLFYKKDIGILARSGFDFETSKKVMTLEKDEYLKIINLL
jgi:regulatory protein